MVALYIVAFGITLSIFVHMFLYRPRRALICALMFVSMCGAALPLHLIDLAGVTSTLKLTLTFVAVLYSIIRRDRLKLLSYVLNPYSRALLLLWVTLLVFCLKSEAADYGLSKTLLLGLNGLVPLAGIGLLSPLSDKDIESIYRTLVVGALLVALNYLAFADLAEVRPNLGSVSALSVSRSIGLGLTLIVVGLLLRPLRVCDLMVSSVIAGLLVAALLVAGSRGPLFSTLLSLGAAVLLSRYRLQTRLGMAGRLILIGLGLVGLFYMGGFNAFQGDRQGVERLVAYTQNLGETTSDRGRLDRFQVAFQGFRESWGLGLGTGGFSPLYHSRGGPFRTIDFEYPHNLVLEIAVEQGIVGIVMFFVIAVLVVRRFKMVLREYSECWFVIAVLSTIFYALFNSMVSADIAGNYFLWLLAGIPWLMRGTSRTRGGALDVIRTGAMGRVGERAWTPRASRQCSALAPGSTKAQGG